MPILLELLRNAAALLSGLSPWIADQIGLLPFINPAIKEAVWKITAVLAGLSGLIFYLSVLFVNHKIASGWAKRCFGLIMVGGLLVTFASLSVMLAITGEITLTGRPAEARFAMMIAYTLCFVGLSSSVGTAIGLRRVV